jgi:hypothetical protein
MRVERPASIGRTIEATITREQLYCCQRIDI